MYSLYFMYCEPPGHQGVTRGLIPESAHQGAQVGTGGVAVEGGVLLHKLQGIMHDMCSTANLTATLMKEVRDASGQLQFGYDNCEVRGGSRGETLV